MRNTYLVCYDISNDLRRARVLSSAEERRPH